MTQSHSKEAIVAKFTDESYRVKLEQLRKKIVQKLLSTEYWKYVFDDLPSIKKRQRTRKQAKTIKGIEMVKEILLKRFGYIPVYFYLHLMASVCGTPEGPYRKSELYLLTLYMLVKNQSPEGLDCLEMIPATSIRRVADYIWEENHLELDIVIDKMLSNMFSNPLLRSVTAKLENDADFLFATFFLDGHDTRIEYSNLAQYGRFDYWSFKFKNSGIRTQVLMDVQEMAIAVSESEPCKANTDMKMFQIMKIHEKVDMTNQDVVFLDGGYYLNMDTYVENLQEKGIEFGLNNFRTPIRKFKNVDLDESEKAYNEKFGAFRGTVETLFSFVAEKFEYFSNKNQALCLTNIEQRWNIQFKLSLLMINIYKFCKKYHVETQFKHKLWLNKNFEFSFDAEKTFSPSVSVEKQLDFSHNSLLKQSEYLDLVLNMDDDQLTLELEREFSSSNHPTYNPLEDDSTQSSSPILGTRQSLSLNNESSESELSESESSESDNSESEPSQSPLLKKPPPISSLPTNEDSEMNDEPPPTTRKQPTTKSQSRQFDSRNRSENSTAKPQSTSKSNQQRVNQSKQGAKRILSSPTSSAPPKKTKNSNNSYPKGYYSPNAKELQRVSLSKQIAQAANEGAARGRKSKR